MEIKVKQQIYQQDNLIVKRSQNLRENRQKVGISPMQRKLSSDTLPHDLKTPLHTILSSANLLKKHSTNTEDVRLVESIEKAGHQLLALFDKFLLPDIVENAAAELDEVKTDNADISHHAGSFQKILVVDDNNINRKIAKNILEDQGYTVELAKDGYAAVEKSLIGHFDLILMDLQMPLMNGIEAAKAIREAEKRGALDTSPVILALTANTNPKDKDACMLAGMNGFLSKPFEWDKLHYLLKTFSNA